MDKDKAKEILYKHAKSNGCKSDLIRNPFLEQAVLNAINEALSQPNVVEQSEQLSFTDDTMPPMGSKEFDCYHGFCKCKQDCKA